ncbi:hypothetical protein HK102_005684 [Quaeritorhiza haematococci]|nr:hypothetical protein HK102_005684 [Quaeritorhiza haematococci]
MWLHRRLAEAGLETTAPEWHKSVGITLALMSGFFIGSSFIFKKKGLLDTNALGHEAGKGHAYLKSGMWWAGMILMGVGEVANFGAYAFSPAILVTPLGALSVVISSTENITQFMSYVTAPDELERPHVLIFSNFTPSQQISSLPEKFLDLGFGSSLVYTFAHWEEDNQFLQWPIYPLFGFVVLTVTMQINYLNKALNLFSTAIVTPVYYVFFTTATLVSSAVLFQGFHLASGIAVACIFMGFLVIVGGVALLFEYNFRLTKLMTKNMAKRSNQNTPVLESVAMRRLSRSEEGPLRSAMDDDDDDDDDELKENVAQAIAFHSSMGLSTPTSADPLVKPPTAFGNRTGGVGGGFNEGGKMELGQSDIRISPQPPLSALTKNNRLGLPMPSLDTSKFMAPLKRTNSSSAARYQVVGTSPSDTDDAFAIDSPL